MDGDGKDPPPPQCYNEIKKPSAYRANGPAMISSSLKWASVGGRCSGVACSQVLGSSCWF